MPNHGARTKAIKTKKFSVQRRLTRTINKDKDDRQELMDYNAANISKTQN